MRAGDESFGSFLPTAHLISDLGRDNGQGTALRGNQGTGLDRALGFVQDTAPEDDLAVARLQSPHNIGIGTTPLDRFQALDLQRQAEIGVNTLGINRNKRRSCRNRACGPVPLPAPEE